ncbi:recombinase family protein [Chryseobacterium sp. HSC-36S06]|uniref:recombinase family protein n=1 Tax=Chryseobacterium sp. HSC-36S06 TaxID=2910970 RepID=UPI00209DA4FC|nr:recombinase family protein [Chryseobacterium sp. HSC-36S06]MCP2037322.1 DNA invertase Pin-like site-specific DNA recombinase [Chryseobacterium sp. HSC-36S06]
MTQKACIYSRVSTNDGKQDTKGQVGVLVDLALKQGYKQEQIEIFEENLSGYLRVSERPKLNEITFRIKNDPQYFSTVFVTELSRLGRTPRDVKNLVEEWTELGVNIHIRNNNLQTITNGKRDMVTHMLIGLLVEFYNFEVQTFKERSRYGLLRAARSGKMGGGIYHLYGYRKDDFGKMTIDDTESNVVQRIFDLYLEGNGVKVIANILNKNNIPTKTKGSFPEKVINRKTGRKGKDIKWTDGQIYSILTNTSYIGKRKYLDEVVDCPIIIEEEKFITIQERLRERNSKGNSVYIYLLKGKIVCGRCGRNYVGRFKPETKGDKVYKCSSTRIGGHYCTNKGVNIKQIESILYHFSFHILRVVNYIKFSRELRADLSSNIEILENEITGVEYEIKKIELRHDRLLDIYLDEALEKSEFYKQRDNNEKQLIQKKKRLKEIKREISAKKKELNNNTKTEILDSTENRTVLQDYFSKVYDRIVIDSHNANNYVVTAEIKLINNHKFVFELLVDKSALRKKNKKYYYTIKSGKLLYGDEIIPFADKEIGDSPQLDRANIVTWDKAALKDRYTNNFPSLPKELISKIDSEGAKWGFIKLLSNTLWNSVWYDVDEQFHIDMKNALIEEMVENFT